jgi:hypothetical protein
MLSHIWREMRGSVRPCGFCSNSLSVGGSSARARAAKESMIRFTHSSCTAVSGVPKPSRAPKKAVSRATTFTVSWNWTNLRRFSKTLRPHRMADTVETKLSSTITTSDASRATCEPEPMAKPTSAFFRAGASLTPSPVMPTTSP